MGRQDVGLVLVGQGRSAQTAAQHVDALAAGQGAADQYPGFDALADHLFHAELDAAVIQQHDVARLQFTGQRRIVGTDPGLIAQVAAQAGIDGEGVARLQPDAAVGKAGDSDLGALQVGEDAYLAVEAGGAGPDLGRQGQVLLRTAVGEVKPEYIGSRLDQLLHHGGG